MSNVLIVQTSATGKKRLRPIDFIANNIDTNQQVNCGAGPQVWSAVYTSTGRYAGPHYPCALPV